MNKTLPERLKDAFDPHFRAPIEAWEQFAELCDPVTFKKNEIIKPYGKTESYGYFILRGSGGVFVWKGNNYVCLDLFYEESFFADYMSLITGQPSELETVALEHSEMLRISASDIALLKQTEMGRTLFLVSAEFSFVDKQRQQIDLLLKTAEQRYRDLLRKQPKLIQRTAQKHIASYLGITTQSLSRLRRNISGS